MAASRRVRAALLAALGGVLGLVAVTGPHGRGDEVATGTGHTAAPAPVPAPAPTTPHSPGILRFGPTGGAPGSTSPHTPTPQRPPPEWHEFYFTRAAYSSGRGGWGRRGDSWATDYPKADRQFLTVLRRLTNLDAYNDENAVLLTDPSIRRYPFLYALEVGYMSMSPDEIVGLREYLMAGGFLVIDDFWGSREWAQFEYQMGLVFPNHPIIELDLEHPVFSTFYDIDEILQVPAYGRWGGRTSERDGFVPHVRGIEDDEGRLMVLINWNTDLGDAWEWAEQPDYPLHFSTFAFQMGVNMIIYGMSH